MVFYGHSILSIVQGCSHQLHHLQAPCFLEFQQQQQHQDDVVMHQIIPPDLRFQKRPVNVNPVTPYW
jgi:hypothetical protein